MNGSVLPAPLDLLAPLVGGLVITVELTFGAAIVAAVFALVAGIGRLSSRRTFRAVALVYVEVFRGTSALVQLFWAYFALPLVGVSLDALSCGIVVLGLNSGAYGAEVVRGAVQAVPRGQWEAATALGLSRRQTLTRIVVPQALLPMLPPISNLLVELLKNTALVSMITLGELTFRGQTLRAETLRTTEIFGLMLILYFALALVLTRSMRALERALAVGRDHSGAR